MITVNSISGGRTSSYMAVHYPADYTLFSLVKINERIKVYDPAIVREVSSKLGVEFIATAENEKTLKVVLDLEQMIGREIKWLHGESFDELIRRKKALPNKFWRFCTQELKIAPMFKWWQDNMNGEVITMNIGYRYDEEERRKDFQETSKYVSGKRGTRNKWDEVKWRVGGFPMVDDGVHHFEVMVWAISSGLIFPLDSNCAGCFWKDDPQLRKNWDDDPEVMQWFTNQETKRRKFKNGMSYQSIKKLAIQLDFDYGTGPGCKAGECTP